MVLQLGAHTIEGPWMACRKHWGAAVNEAEKAPDLGDMLLDAQGLITFGWFRIQTDVPNVFEKIRKTAGPANIILQFDLSFRSEGFKESFSKLILAGVKGYHVHHG